MKTYFLFPHLQVETRFKKVYHKEKLPYPGDPSCDCDPCQEAWMNGLAEALRRSG